MIAVTLAWVRAHNEAPFYQDGQFLLASIPNGWTYKRIRWSWGFAGFTNVTTDLAAQVTNIGMAGLVTTIGDGTETAPRPISTPNDVAPPTQRWLWWEARQAIAVSVDGTSDTVSWRDSGPQEIPDVRTQVLAVGAGAGEFLNLWFTWQSFFGAWDSSGEMSMWAAASILYNIP